MSILMIAIASTALAILFGILFYFFISVNKLHSKYTDKITVNSALRNGMIMNFIGQFPYSQLMLSEAKDCPLCFEQFKQDSNVVQLKCNKHHLFHHKCMEEYLKYEDDNQPIIVTKKCPLCRHQVEIEEEPNFLALRDSI